MDSTFDPAIDHEYMPSEWSPRNETGNLFVYKGTKFSEEFRTKFAKNLEVVRYGDGPKQLMDIMSPDDVIEETPIVIFVHGGYWVESGRDMHLCVIKPSFDRGFIGVNIGYDQAPDVSLTTIVNQIRAAYLFISKKFPNCRQMTATGHSAGGHLAAMLLSTNWDAWCPGEKVLPISRCVPISGIFDVRPTLHIRYNEQLKLTQQEMQNLSPILLTKAAIANAKSFGTEIISAVAEHDPPSFRRMSNDYAQALKDLSAKHVVIKGVDHFEIIEKFYTDPDFELNQIIF